MEMRELLDRIIEAKRRENSFFYEDPIRPRAGKPASAAELAHLDQYLAGKGLKTPPSYREFLSVYNGIEDILMSQYSLLPIQSVVDEEYELLDENLEEFPDYCEFVIAAGNTPAFIGFDTGRDAPGGEYEVVEVTPEGDETRFKTFRDFLTRYLRAVERNVRAEEKDRERLPD